MLNRVKMLSGYKLHALNGEIGKIKEFYFDDRNWMIRYLVADTGNWLMDRQVLISPHALVDINKDEKYISVNLSKQEIEDSPPLASDKPVSRQFEDSYFGFYGWPTYWGSSYMWGTVPYIVHDRVNRKEFPPTESKGDPNLRSTKELAGVYKIEATDGVIGHVDDFIIDNEEWAIRYLIVKTQDWWSGKKVLISPQWIERLSWTESKVFLNLSSKQIKESPEFTDESLLTRDHEWELYRHYNRRGYWIDLQASQDTYNGLRRGISEDFHITENSRIPSRMDNSNGAKKWKSIRARN